VARANRDVGTDGRGRPRALQVRELERFDPFQPLGDLTGEHLAEGGQIPLAHGRRPLPPGRVASNRPRALGKFQPPTTACGQEGSGRHLQVNQVTNLLLDLVSETTFLCISGKVFGVGMLSFQKVIQVRTFTSLRPISGTRGPWIGGSNFALFDPIWSQKRGAPCLNLGLGS